MPFVLLEYASERELKAGKTKDVLAGVGEAATALELAEFALTRLTWLELVGLETKIRKILAKRPASPRGPAGNLGARAVR